MEKGKKYSANSYLDIKKISSEKREEIFKIMKEEEKPFHCLFDVPSKEMAKYFISTQNFSDIVKKTLIYLIDQCTERGLTFDILTGFNLNQEVINVIKNKFVTDEFNKTKPIDNLWFFTGWMYKIVWSVNDSCTRIEIQPVNITNEYLEITTLQKIDTIEL